MPRYLFNVIDGQSTPDDTGTDFPNVYEAQNEAVRFCGELVRELGGRLWDGNEWRLEVCSEHGRTLFVLKLSAEERFDSGMIEGHVLSR